MIDHDEDKCANLLHGNCKYIIVVLNPSDRKSGLYKIVVSHSQNNHAMLQEANPHIDSVELEELKYFKFTLSEEEENISNVTIEINPLHGDSDLYVSHLD